MTARRLHPVPERAPRALGLVRVSKERDGMIAPDVQRVAISDYCAVRGYDLTGWAEGIDESGSRARSAWWPRLDQAVADVETGDYDVIVVWKFSRIARHRLRWAVAIDRVEEAGGRIESATEQVDTTTSTGRFTRGMLAELQAFEAERIGEVWKEVHARRLAAGKPPNGKPKWGYIYDRDMKLHVPDPVTGPVLVDLYRRYVAGDSVYALVRWLNAHGWTTLAGGPWSDHTLRRVMGTGFAAGRVPAPGTTAGFVPGAHDALIGPELWQAYVDSRSARRARPARTERSEYLLSGLVRCGRCEGPMVAGQFGHAHAPKYRCATSKERGAEACTGGYVMAAYLERLVLDQLEEWAGDLDARRRQALAAQHQAVVRHSEADRLARELARTDEALVRLAVQDAKAPIPPVAFERAKADLVRQHAELEAALEVAGAAARAAVQDPGAMAADLLAGWHKIPVQHRREALRRLIHHVRVWSGRPRADVQILENFYA